MFKEARTFSGFSVNDIKAAQDFYGNTLGLKTTVNEMGLTLHTAHQGDIFVYPKPNHAPADFTILNFVVEDINGTIDALVEKGVKFEHYQDLPAAQDERGVLRGLAAGQGPDIAWFKDPAGNTLAVLQES